MELIQALQASPALLVFAVALLGLCVGSFLNVVAYRMPVMLEQEFRCGCHEEYGCPDPVPKAERVSLLRPPSTCGSCKARIRPWHNIPVLGWILLRGRCASCSAPISIQYPIVEGLTAVLSVACAMRFGWSPQLAGALIATWLLIALTVIDLKTMYLPDDLTLPLLWLGLLASAVPVFADGTSAAVGAAAGFIALWAVARLFELATRREKGEAMGEGDFKLLAGLGAWLGWQALPQVILLSAAVGSVVGVTLIVAGRREKSGQIPFGPYIAGAGWIAMVWGPAINAAYFSYLGPS